MKVIYDLIIFVKKKVCVETYWEK